ncbi:alpha/beta hydrolase [Actinomadura sp. ATCC 31491]|uniref:Alpha/beta hydrolase n=1 Tax=Actinomadura luzonensis TaxID=2805427 RepID=A0ABT0FM69_9ACTN|nr:alpha/beta hydrolase [Actinomadura luzonensis]MCK2213440.1 alpha/beta hydrolase [Actinomadura luzonensis]
MSEKTPPLGRTYEVAGRRLALHRSGEGGPAVVFLPGAGLVGLDFLNVHERVAAFTTSVVYDRAGTGWSDPAPLPRRPGEVAGELRELLRAAGVPGPYVLAGHSLGAFYARRYAQLHPADVAGLLLLDPGHEDIASYLPPEMTELNERMKPDPAQLPELTDEQLAAGRAQYAQLYAAWPDAVRDALAEHHLTTWRSSLAETENFETDVYDELRGGGPLPDVPLLVLTAGGDNPYWERFMSRELMRQGLDGIRAMHAAIAASVPRGEQRVLEGGSHQYAHLEQADEVVRAVRDLVKR